MALDIALLVVFLIVVVGGCGWVAYLATRVPRKPEHERQPQRMPDPTLTSHKGGQGGL